MKYPGPLLWWHERARSFIIRLLERPITASNRQLKKDDIFRIASQTKAITATAVMMLWEEGKFRLDDPVSNFIPEFKNPQVLDSLIERDSSFVAVQGG